MSSSLLSINKNYKINNDKSINIAQKSQRVNSEKM